MKGLRSEWSPAGDGEVRWELEVSVIVHRTILILYGNVLTVYGKMLIVYGF